MKNGGSGNSRRIGHDSTRDIIGEHVTIIARKLTMTLVLDILATKRSCDDTQETGSDKSKFSSSCYDLHCGILTPQIGRKSHQRPLPSLNTVD
jgi:hypothetical protein